MHFCESQLKIVIVRSPSNTWSQNIWPIVSVRCDLLPFIRVNGCVTFDQLRHHTTSCLQLHEEPGHAKKYICFRHSLPVTGSGGSIHQTCPAPKRLCCMSSRCDQMRKKLFHTPAVCVSKNSVHFSPSPVQHLHWYVLCVSFSGASSSFSSAHGGGHLVPQYLA